MKIWPLLASAVLIVAFPGVAESRTFTNSAGKKIEAELIAMEGEAAVLKLGNGRTAKVPLASLSTDDQAYVKTWWEENRNKVSASDLRLTIKKNSKRVRERADDSKKGNKKNQNKSSKTETSWTCTLENLSTKNIEGLKAEYTIYEKVSERGDEGSDTRTEETYNEAEVGVLEPNGTLEFTSDSEISEDSETKKKDSFQSRKETIVGFTVTLLLDGKEILKQGHPDNFLRRLEEEAKREAARKKK